VEVVEEKFGESRIETKEDGSAADWGKKAGAVCNQGWNEGVRDLACAMHGSIGDRQEVSPWEKIVGPGTVGIEELRCTGGAGETTTPAGRRQVEVVGRGSTD
jgi:hypothetical protein